MNEGRYVRLPAEEQPISVEMETIDEVFIKTLSVPKAQTFIPQHSHHYDHASLLAKGEVWLWKDGVLDGKHKAPCIIHIKAGVKHLFQTLEDDTLICCIHNLMRSEVVEILEEHQIA